MKQIIFLFSLLFSFSSFAQIEGTWNGNIEIPNQKLPFVIHITKTANQWEALGESPMQTDEKFPLEKITFQNDTLKISDSKSGMNYVGFLKDANYIEGTFKQATYSFMLNLTKEEPKKNISSSAQNYNVKEIKVSEELIGDLYETSNQETVVLLIAGSGPTNRNGNTMGMSVNNSLKFLAEGLAENNYDVFTYDKRVVYLLKNNKEIPSMDFQHGIDDAATIIDYLKNDLGYKNVVVAGHSEGSLVGMSAIQNNGSAFISLAGSGSPIDEILREQINKKAPMFNEANDKILTELKAGNIVKDVHPMLESLYAEQSQPFLIDWMKRNPQTEIAKLNIPVLIINGTKDIQVEVKEAELLHKANPNSTLIIIENMNHLFKEITKDEENIASYNNPDLPVQEELITTIVSFLQKL